MSVKVGINGFGRIGRNIFRAALGDPLDRNRGRQRHHGFEDARPSAEIRFDPRQSPEQGHPHRRLDLRRRQSLQGFQVKDPAEIDWASVGATHRGRIDGPLHRGRRRAQAHSRAGEESDHLRAGHRSGPHHCARRERQDLRSGQAPRGFQRFLHHELPGAGRQSACRTLSASPSAR